MLSDVLFLLFTLAICIGLELGASSALLRLLQLSQLITVWAVASSYATISLLLSAHLLLGPEHPWAGKACHYLDWRAVACACALCTLPTAVMMGAELLSPDKDTTNKTVITCLLSTLFTLLYALPLAALTTACGAYIRTAGWGLEGPKELTRIQMRALLSHVTRLALTLLLFHILPALLVFVALVAGGGGCAIREGYRLLNTAFLAGYAVCMGRVVADGLLDWMDGGYVWHVLSFE